MYKLRGVLGRSFALAMIALVPGAGPAAAHHAMGGSAPTTWIEGLLSSLAHPVIGLDHLAFVVAAGVIAAYLSSGWRVPATFAAFSIAGVALRFVLPDMQFAEAAVAGTVVMAGLAMAIGRLGPAAAWIAFATLAGLLHGYAFGEAVVGAEATPILWYLFGLAASQLAVSNTVMAVVGMTLTHDATHSWRTRTAGAAIALLGSALLATSVFQV